MPFGMYLTAGAGIGTFLNVEFRWVSILPYFPPSFKTGLPPIAAGQRVWLPGRKDTCRRQDGDSGVK